MPIFKRKFFKRKRPLYKKKASFKRKTGWNKTYKKKRYLKKTFGKTKYKKRISSILGRSTRLKLKTMAKALETKYMEYINVDNPQLATAQTTMPDNVSARNTWTGQCAIPFLYDNPAYFYITQGTQKSQRIGNKITLKQLRLKGSFWFSAFDSGNLDGGIRYNEAWENGKASLTCVILTCKTDTDFTAPAAAVLFPGLKIGSSGGSIGPQHHQNTIIDYTKPYGIENRNETPRLKQFKVVYKKTFYPTKTNNTDLRQKYATASAIALSTISFRRVNRIQIPIDVNMKKQITMEWKTSGDVVPQRNNIYIYWIPTHDITQERTGDNGLTFTTEWNHRICKWVDC